MCRPSVFAISGLSFCSLDLRVGGLGAGRLGTGDGPGGGRRLVTCLTSSLPLVKAGEVLESDLEEPIEVALAMLCVDSLIGLEDVPLFVLGGMLLYEYPVPLFEFAVFDGVLLVEEAAGLE